VVLEAMGAGHVPVALVPHIDALLGAMPVVLATRVPAGPVFTRTYAFPGSETDLIARGVTNAGFLGAPKAFQLLRLLLCSGAGRSDIAQQLALRAHARA
jgi:L-asparaginase